jgi:hypothetical protein
VKYEFGPVQEISSYKPPADLPPVYRGATYRVRVTATPSWLARLVGRRRRSTILYRKVDNYWYFPNYRRVPSRLDRKADTALNAQTSPHMSLPDWGPAGMSHELPAAWVVK